MLVFAGFPRVKLAVLSDQRIKARPIETGRNWNKGGDIYPW
jgi:hypothetical protein